MADLSIFKLDNQSITIKDTTARQTAESAKALATAAATAGNAVREQITELKNDLSEIRIQEKIEPNNLLNPDNISSGYYWSNGWNESSSYSNTGYIPVKSGKTYSLWTNANSGTFRKEVMRFVVSYDSDKNFLNTYANITDFAPQTSEKFIIISAVPAYLTSQGMVTTLVENVTYEPYFEPHMEVSVNMDKVDAYTKEEADARFEPSNDYKFDELFSELDVSEQQNLYDASTATDGYIAANGNISPSDTYCYSSKIPVKAGNTYTFWALYNGNVVSANARFLCAYDSENNAVSASGSNSAVASYTVPNGIASIVVSFEQTRKHLFMVVEGTTQPESLLPYNLAHYIAKESFVKSAFGNLIRGNESVKMTVATAEPGTQYDLIDHVDNKKNCSYSFFGKFSSFTSVQIGHGKTETGACYMTIDGTNITSYKPDGTAYATVAHGLAITDFIAVSIKVADTKSARARVTIITNGGSATVGNIIFFGCNGKVHFQCGQETTDVEFVYNIMDLRKDVFVFGDSYCSLADDKRWTEYAITENDNNILISGFAGADAGEEYPSFENIVAMKNPKYLCWFLGMNNPDKQDSINSNWVIRANQVLSYCDANGIVPILATVPNTPTQRNVEKNNWVKSSGRRYVDFAKAVGAESAGSSWYTGMLSSDNVHPTAEGAKALWLRLRLDVPEIMERITA